MVGDYVGGEFSFHFLVEPLAAHGVLDCPLQTVSHTFRTLVFGNVAAVQMVHNVALPAFAKGYGQTTAGLSLNERARQIFVERSGKHDIAVAIEAIEF